MSINLPYTKHTNEKSKLFLKKFQSYKHKNTKSYVIRNYQYEKNDITTFLD